MKRVFALVGLAMILGAGIWAQAAKAKADDCKNCCPSCPPGCPDNCCPKK